MPLVNGRDKPSVHHNDRRQRRYRVQVLVVGQNVRAGLAHAQAGTTSTEEDGAPIARISGTEASTIRPVSISKASGRR